MTVGAIVKCRGIGNAGVIILGALMLSACAQPQPPIPWEETLLSKCREADKVKIRDDVAFSEFVEFISTRSTARRHQTWSEEIRSAGYAIDYTTYIESLPYGITEIPIPIRENERIIAVVFNAVLNKPESGAFVVDSPKDLDCAYNFPEMYPLFWQTLNPR